MCRKLGIQNVLLGKNLTNPIDSFFIKGKNIPKNSWQSNILMLLGAVDPKNTYVYCSNKYN